MEYFRVQLRRQLQVGIPVSSTIEVLSISLQDICRVPDIDPIFLGVMNWRGRLLWSFDLNDLLGIEDNNSAGYLAQSTFPLIVLGQERDSQMAGCLVSEMEELIEVDKSEVMQLPKTLPARVRPYFSGVIRRNVPILLLDPAIILDSAHWKARHEELDLTLN